MPALGEKHRTGSRDETRQWALLELPLRSSRAADGGGGSQLSSGGPLRRPRIHKFDARIGHMYNASNFTKKELANRPRRWRSGWGVTSCLQPPSFFEQVCRRASDAPRSPEIARRGPEIARDSARSPEIARRGPRSRSSAYLQSRARAKCAVCRASGPPRSSEAVWQSVLCVGQRATAVVVCRPTVVCGVRAAVRYRRGLRVRPAPQRCACAESRESPEKPRVSACRVYCISIKCRVSYTLPDAGAQRDACPSNEQTGAVEVRLYYTLHRMTGTPFRYVSPRYCTCY